jgi:hypothetical protein
MSAADKQAAGGEEAKASSSLLSKEHMEFAKHIGAITARGCFEERGNHSEAHLSEAELATLCAGAAGAAIKLIFDRAKADLAQGLAERAKIVDQDLGKNLKVEILELFLPDFSHEVFQRPVIVHLGKDGSIRWLNRKGLEQPVVVESLMPVFSVETEEQAKSLQVVFGKLQYRDSKSDPGKPWYILHRMPDGTLLMNREPPYLQLSDLPEITKMFATWYDGLYGKKPEGVRAS